MRIVIFKENGKWYAKVYNGNAVIYWSKAEARAGCAVRAAFNYLQGTYGPPSVDNFVMDVSDW